MVDKWEAQIANGEVPDLYEAFDEESLSHIERLRQLARDKDPYQGLSMKAAFDKIEREATREGLHIGNKPSINADKQKLLEELFNNPTFGGNPE